MQGKYDSANIPSALERIVREALSAGKYTWQAYEMAFTYIGTKSEWMIEDMRSSKSGYGSTSLKQFCPYFIEHQVEVSEDLRNKVANDLIQLGVMIVAYTDSGRGQARVINMVVDLCKAIEIYDPDKLLQDLRDFTSTFPRKKSEDHERRKPGYIDIVKLRYDRAIASIELVLKDKALSRDPVKRS